MTLRTLTALRRIVVGTVLLIASALCVFVPFEAELNGTKSQIGYAFIWSPPSRVESCEAAFMPKKFPGSKESFDSGDYAWQLTLRGNCTVRPSFPQIILTNLGLMLFGAFLLLFIGIAARKKQPA